MPITLDAIALDDDLQWSDEFDWTPIERAETRSLTGALIIEEATRQMGRPITLTGGNWAFPPRSTVNALFALLTANQSMTLTLIDGRVFTVGWRHNEKPIEAQPVVFQAPLVASDPYTLTLRLQVIA